jgi:hypothetical protein
MTKEEIGENGGNGTDLGANATHLDGLFERGSEIGEVVRVRWWLKVWRLRLRSRPGHKLWPWQ